jgi:DNA invertase Pin-like site-specific DNA recombinase
MGDCKKYVAYLRVSTARQGRSGLGIEAQRAAVAAFMQGRSGRLLDPEFVEIESGRKSDREELSKALARCRVTGAILIVAKLDRLSRNAGFLMTLRDAGVDFIAADLPEANALTVGIMALVAQAEAEAIAARTKAALAAARARGVNLGGRRAGSPSIAKFQHRGSEAATQRANKRLSDVAADLRTLHAEGLSLNAIASRLNASDVRGTGGGLWTATAVRRALGRLERGAVS